MQYKNKPLLMTNNFQTCMNFIVNNIHMYQINHILKSLKVEGIKCVKYLMTTFLCEVWLTRQKVYF